MEKFLKKKTEPSGCLPFSGLLITFISSLRLRNQARETKRMVDSLATQVKEQPTYNKTYSEEFFTTRTFGEVQSETLSLIVKNYMQFLSMRNNGDRVIFSDSQRKGSMYLPEALEDVLVLLLDKPKSERGKQELDFKYLADALELIDKTEDMARSQSIQLFIDPLIYQIRGNVYEIIAARVKSERAAAYWFLQAIQSYIAADENDMFSTDPIITNPLKVLELLKKIGEEETVRAFSDE